MRIPAVGIWQLKMIHGPTPLAGARPFDRDGQPAARFSLVVGGVLESFL
jgi:predicted Zn-dependent protease